MFVGWELLFVLSLFLWWERFYFSPPWLQSEQAGPPVSLLLCAASSPSCQFEAGLCLIYEKIANIPNCRCLSSRCGAARQNARSIYFHSATLLKWEILNQQICLTNQTRKTQSNQTHICYWRNMMITICKRKSFSWSFEIIKNNGLKVVLLCTAVNISMYYFLAAEWGFLVVSPPLPFQLFSTQLHIFAAEGETNEQSFQYWSRLNSYCSCRNAI